MMIGFLVAKGRQSFEEILRMKVSQIIDCYFILLKSIELDNKERKRVGFY